MKSFFILWVGQLVSGVGSALTGFALAVWAYQAHGSVSELSGIVMAATLPGILLAPAAGAWVDRWNRRAVLLLADVVAAVATGALALLIYEGRLELWHLLTLLAISSMSRAFQEPAYLASVPLIVARKHLGRAGGLAHLSTGLSTALAPAIGGTLVAWIGISGVMLFDLASFGVSILSLLFVRIPPPPESVEGRQGRGALRGEIAAGWSYLRVRPGLFRLLAIFAVTSFLVGIASLLYIPLVLSFTTSVQLGLTVSLASLGMIAGSLIIATRGVPERKIPAGMGFMFLGGLCMSVVGLQSRIWLIGVATTALLFLLPLARGTDQVLWQSKIAPDLQGRVFALRRLIARGAVPLAYLAGGPLADHVFEPAMREGGWLAHSVGQLLGVGPGRGIGLMFVLAGAIVAALAVFGYSQSAIRNLERDVPDSLPPEPGPVPQPVAP